jgi:hypothetical protein
MRAAVATLLTATVLAAFAAGPSDACLACIAMPAESLADRVLAAEVVALLRPAPDDPFRYVPGAFLRGGPDVPPVPFLVSRDRAAVMAADPSMSVVATWTPDAGWTMHDAGSPVLVAVLQAVLAAGPVTDTVRRDFFAPLVQNADPAVERMALIELATLPYVVLREAPASIGHRRLAALLSDPVWADWAPVVILLCGLSDDPADNGFVRRAAHLIANDGRTAHLAAWATALIEIDGRTGLDFLRESYLDAPDRSDAELREIALALASHAPRSDALGPDIRATLSALAASRPALAGPLATALTERADWSLAPVFAGWLDAGQITNPDEAFLVTHYLLAAEAAAAPPQD